MGPQGDEQTGASPLVTRDGEPSLRVNTNRRPFPLTYALSVSSRIDSASTFVAFTRSSMPQYSSG